jgi:predicted TPR repeat methyltransferase
MNRKARRLAQKLGGFDALLASAEARKRDGRPDEAIALYQRALAMRPDSAPARNELANFLRSAGRVAEAVQQFSELIARHPQIPEPYNNLGITLGSQGLDAEAIPHFQRALALKPDFLDARINLGLSLAHCRRLAEALQQVEIAARSTMQPSFPMFQFAMLLARLNCIDAARTCLQAYLARNPDDSLGARLVLAGLGGAALPERASRAQLDRLYAQRAASWDRTASGDFAYGGARLVAELLQQLAGPATDLDILDAGCGTGLVGELVSGRARRLEGIDMSPAMLAQAKTKGVYHQLHEGDLVELLRSREAAFDAITCAATLIHFGELRPPLEAAATSLRDGGLFVFTLFPNEQDENAVAAGSLDGLGEGGCFAHGSRYVAGLAEATGFAVERMETQVHEYVAGKPRMGLVVALRRAPRVPLVPMGPDPCFTDNRETRV